MKDIFRGYSADRLEQEYRPQFWPNVDVQEITDRWEKMGRAFHQRSNVKRDISYGDTSRQCLDLIVPEAPDSPVLIFIHGGYWRSRRLDKVSSSFCVEPIVTAGGLVAMVEYDLCPDVAMDTLIEQVRKACVWVWRNAAEYGGDPSRLHISGASAGGHLTAMMAATDWSCYEDGLTKDMVKSIIPISGLFELEPLRLTSMNSDLQLTPETAHRSSPRFLEPAVEMPVSVAVGGRESDEFRRQSRDFVAAWREHASRMDYLEIEGENHFTIMDAMIHPDSPLTATILRHLEL